MFTTMSSLRRSLGSFIAICLTAAFLPSVIAASEAQAREDDEVLAANMQAKGSPPQGRFRGEDRRSDEVTQRRTRTSRTFVNEFGAFETDLFDTSIHYRSARGNWARINNNFTDSSADRYGYENRANRYRLLLPTALGNAPVRVNANGHFLSLALDRARGAAQVSGNRAEYRDALPGVSAVYFALNDSVKENLVLSDASSTSTFTWTVRSSARLTPKINSVGGVDFVDPSGRRMFSIPQPFIHDANDDVAPVHAFELVEQNQQTKLRLTVDQRWLTAPSTQFPVTVDPTLQVGPKDKTPSRDCWINEGQPSGNYCGGNYVRVGFDGTSAKRSLIDFDLSKFPDNATVLHARLGVNLVKETNDTAPQAIALRPATEHWNDYVTWENRWATTAWTRAGGTFDYNKGYLLEAIQGPGTYNFHPTKLVQEWISGETNNHGLVLKTRFEDVDNVMFFSAGDNTIAAPKPTLTVTWDYGGMGEFDTYKLEEHQLTDRAHLHANVAGGNMSVHHTDLLIRGVGLDLKIDRHYNSLMQTNLLDTASNVGDGWTFSTGGDVGLKVYGDDSVAFFGPSGYRVPFHTESTLGELQSPPGLKADLLHHNDGFTLTWRQSKEKMHFSPGGYIQSHEDKNGNKITFGYEGDKVVSITDTLGRATTLTYDPANGQLDKITDPMGRVHDYDYTGQKLTSYTNPQNERYTYEYDGNENLWILTDPKGRLEGEKGNQTRFTYDTTAGSDTEDWIKQIKYVTDDTTSPATGHTLDFGYDHTIAGTECDVRGSEDPALVGLDPVAHTVVTDNRGNKTKYCYNKDSRVEIIFDAKDNRTTMKYNAEANVERFFDAMGREYTYGYDQTSGDLLTSSSPGDSTKDLGETGELHYTDDGHDHGGDGHDHDNDGVKSDEHKHLPIKVVDARGFHTNLEYDGNNNLTRVEQSPNQDNVVFRYDYDPTGNITRIRAPEPEPDPLDGNGNETQGNDTVFSYYPEDAAPDGDDGMLQSIDRPDAGGLGDVTLEYDAVSRVIATTDGKGQRTTVTYDHVDRVKEIIYADGRSMTYNYDLAGNVIDRTDRQGRKHVFTYDGKNQLDTHTRPDPKPDDGVDDSSVIDYGYNTVGDLNRIKDRGRETKYHYDITNVMNQVTEPDGDVISFNVNEAYEYWRIDFPNRVRQLIERSRSGKVKRIYAFDRGALGDSTDNGAPFRDLNYDYNITQPDGTKKDQGLIQTITDKQSTTSHFTYDSVGRLERERIVKSDGSVNRNHLYDYDDNSNRTYAKAKDPQGNITETEFHYNHANQLVCSYVADSRSNCDSATGKTTYAHDGNGNLTAINGPDDPKQFSYDAADHMNRVNHDSKSIDMEYQDAAQEQRDTKTVTNDLGVVTKEVDYDHDLIGVARETRTDALGQKTFHYIRTPDGRMLGQDTPSGDEYYVLDHLGSVRDVTGANASVKQKYSYAPYGEILWQKASGYDNAWRFAQGYFDTDIGQTKLGVRYYGSDIARFTQFDPMAGKIIDPMSLNKYQYAGCNPANNVDPSGREESAVWCAISLVEVVLAYGDFVAGLAAVLGSPFTGPGMPVTVTAGILGMGSGVYGMYTGMESAEEYCPG